MSIILIILMVLIFLWRLYRILKIVFSVDFLFGTAMVLLFSYYLGMWSRGYYEYFLLIPPLGMLGTTPVILAIGLCILYALTYHKRRRTELNSIGWIIISSIFMCIIIAVVTPHGGDSIFAFAAGILLMLFYKPFRLPWFVALNLILLGFFLFKIDQGLGGDTGDLTVTSDDTSQPVPDDTAMTAYQDNSMDPTNQVGNVHVDGYTRADGTPVREHWRTDPDGILQNNVSYHGPKN